MWFSIVIAVLLFDYLLSSLVETLNLKRLSHEIPLEFKGYYDEEKYKKSQEYLKTNTAFSWKQSTFMLFITCLFLFYDGFAVVDNFLRLQITNDLLRGLAYFGILGGATLLIGLPFSYYHTFVIEEKFGFNKTDLKTFFKDQILAIVLGAVIGGGILALILWFFAEAGSNAWLYCWIALTVIQIFLVTIAPVVIMPLFNKFEVLQAGELKDEIENYAKSQNFDLSGVFTMDGSKRSTKANAYFTGFGKLRRVVLFDTLISKNSVSQLVAILAHEIGHFKLKHIHKQLLVSILSSGLMFYILSLFMNNQSVADDFHLTAPSIYLSLILFGMIYSPISSLISLLSLRMSRKYEFEADRFAIDTYQKPEELAEALKKLSVDSLANLRPHPLKVFFEYTHPPIIERIHAIQAAK